MKFAEFREHDRGQQWNETVVRAVRGGDVPALAAIFAEREGRPLEEATQVVARWAGCGPERLVLVAEHGGRVEGYGKAQWLVPAAGGGDAPAGWYLTGLVVAPEARRHGLGARLTEERIAALAPITDEIWYFANLRNRATIALHERHGFALHTREFTIPGVTFDGDRGALFRLSPTRT